MPSRLVNALVIPPIIGLLLAACSGSDPVGTSGGPPVGYFIFDGTVGVTVAGKSGAFWVRAAIPSTVSGGVVTYAPTGTVDGMLTTVDGQRVPLTGTVVRVSGVFTVQGGAYQFTATAASGATLLTGSGSFTTPATARASGASLIGGSVPIVISAKRSVVGSAAAKYCGSYAGFSTDAGKPTQPESGALCFTIENGRVNGAGTASDGDVVRFWGTATASSFDAGVADGNARLIGQLGSNWSGTYSGGDAENTFQGTWTAPGRPIVIDVPSPPADIPPLTLGT